jgi:hypothetical protein
MSPLLRLLLFLLLFFLLRCLRLSLLLWRSWHRLCTRRRRSVLLRTLAGRRGLPRGWLSCRWTIIPCRRRSGLGPIIGLRRGWPIRGCLRFIRLRCRWPVGSCFWTARLRRGWPIRGCLRFIRLRCRWPVGSCFWTARLRRRWPIGSRFRLVRLRRRWPIIGLSGCRSIIRLCRGRTIVARGRLGRSIGSCFRTIIGLSWLWTVIRLCRRRPICFRRTLIRSCRRSSRLVRWGSRCRLSRSPGICRMTGGRSRRLSRRRLLYHRMGCRGIGWTQTLHFMLR